MARSYTRDRGFTRAGTTRLGRDQEQRAEELNEMFDDPDTSAGELIAALIEYCPDDKAEELRAALRELSEDRNPRLWARDKLELRRLSKDRRARDTRRMGRDLSEGELTSSGPSRSIEDFDRSGNREAQSMDRRRFGAADMAFDSRPMQRLPSGLRLPKVERF